MRFLCFIVGSQGSGKSSVISILKRYEQFHILKPSTTREPRSEGDDEYYFVNSWDEKAYAWSIRKGGQRYGMSHAEVQRVGVDKIGVTVFDPSEINVLEEYRKSADFEILTLGLDTLIDHVEQNSRVGNSPERVLNQTEFENEHETVIRSSAVLSGSTEQISQGIVALCELVLGRGGILPRSIIEPLLQSGLLLENTHGSSQPASYDLSLGDDVWCQGEFIDLSEHNPTLKIPAYSYAIVSAREYANLPSFVSARFDLKNSLFFKGVILSNGPQIDPGYRGALFCMLYNGSDRPVGISRGNHFSTIEFCTTSGFDVGYREQYQDKRKIVDFMPEDAIVSEGGKILERTESKISELEESWKHFRTALFTIFAFVLSPLVLIYFNLLPWIGEADILEELEARVEETERKYAHLVDLIERSGGIESSREAANIELPQESLEADKSEILKEGMESFEEREDQTVISSFPENMQK